MSRNMNQSETPAKTKGRPPEFDRAQVVNAAMSCFWELGYSATTISDLCEAMGINKPSFYGSFGSKKKLYLLALDVFAERAIRNTEQTLFAEADLKTGLVRFYEGMIDLYFKKDKGQGSFVFGTTPIEALDDKEIRAYLKTSIGAIEKALTQRIQQAIAENQLPKKTDAEGLAIVASALLHSISLRARSGEPLPALKKIMRSAVDTLVRA